jgi:RNA-directed DNA polymerase
MSSSRFSLFFMQKRAFKIFNKESKQDYYSTRKLVERSFSSNFLELSDIKKADLFLLKSPYYGHKTFWFDYSLFRYSVKSLSDYIVGNNFFCIFCGAKVWDNF